MKKSLLLSGTLSLLLFFGAYAFSHLSFHSEGLTLQSLLVKAREAEIARAEEGRYLYQKVHSLSVYRSSYELASSIYETWSDTKSADYIEIQYDTGTQHVTWARMVKDGMTYSYSEDGTLLDQGPSTLAINPASFTQGLTKGIQAYLEGGDVQVFENLFPPSHAITSATYIGQTTWKNISVEAVLFTTVNKSNDVKVYFDAGTYEFIGLEIFDTNVNRLINSIEIMDSNFSDDIPSVQVGSTLLAL